MNQGFALGRLHLTHKPAISSKIFFVPSCTVLNLSAIDSPSIISACQRNVTDFLNFSPLSVILNDTPLHGLLFPGVNFDHDRVVWATRARGPVLAVFTHPARDDDLNLFGVIACGDKGIWSYFS